jgi:hypothetical protein
LHHTVIALLVAHTYGSDHAALGDLFAAAPDLYAAASEIIRLHDTYTGEPRDDDAISLAMDDLRAAIARANGEG